MTHWDEIFGRSFTPQERAELDASAKQFDWNKAEAELIEARRACRRIGFADRAAGRPHDHDSMPEYVFYTSDDGTRKVLRWYSEAYDGGYRGESGEPPPEFLAVERTLASMPTAKLEAGD
jgi:hypothetical protein